MGCTPSKQSVCRNCHAECSPVRRSYSSYATHLSPPREGDNNHVVALTSTTLGYLLLDPSAKNNPVRQDAGVARIRQEPVRRNASPKNSMDFAVGMIEAKTWSKMIDKKITKTVPKTPIRTPPGEPDTINAWELMEGLDDSSPALRPLSDQPRFVSQEKDKDTQVLCKPLWLQLAENQSDHNPNSNEASVASRSDELKPFNEKQQSPEKSLPNGKGYIMPASCKEKLILYFTSLRGVRKTYEDCCHVRVILKTSGVRVDERDVSMHSGFKEELKELLGDRYNSGGGLPKVFLGKKYIGGADEIRRFHDEFQLDKVLEGCDKVDGCNDGGGCDGCGDIRFILCETCSGSCKIYYEVNSDKAEDEEIEESDYGFQRCPDCNENGLVRCPICCD